MFRFKSVSVFGSESKPIESNVSCLLDFNYIVDDSHFAPISETVKRLQSTGGSDYSSDEQKTFFDFPDGKVPEGYKVPFVRGPDYKDIAELSQHIMQSQKGVQESIKNDIEKAQDKAMIEQIASKAKSKSSFSSSSSSSSSNGGA